MISGLLVSEERLMDLQYNGQCSFYPNQTPDKLGLVFGAGSWDGSGNRTYWSDTAPPTGRHKYIGFG